MLLHITTRSAWAAALACGSYEPASLAAEGFVHLSTPEQIFGTAERYYRGVADLVVLYVDPARLTAPLRWDFAPDRGEPFPHLYGPLNTDAVRTVEELTENPAGWALRPWRDG